MATDIIARGMITEYKSGTNISFKENDDGSVTISASGNVNTLLDQNGNATLKSYCYSYLFS